VPLHRRQDQSRTVSEAAVEPPDRTVEATMSVQSENPAVHRPVRHFVRHYVEMLVAMAAGMVVLTPLWELGLGAVGASWLLDRVEPATMIMATSMSVPMVAWMRYRGHGWAASLEMAAAMYLSFAVLYPPLWLGLLAVDSVMLVGHVLMLPAMAAAMLLRRDEYTRHHA
jgi:hypothetical protein